MIHGSASDIIRDHYTNGPETKHREFRFAPFAEPVEFNEETIDPSIRKRVNEWIEDIFAIISHDPSTIMTERFLEILTNKSNKHLVALLAEILIFFLSSVNMRISPEKAALYTDFILGEVEKKTKNLKLETF